MKPTPGPYSVHQVNDFKFTIQSKRRVIAVVEQTYDKDGIGISTNQLRANACVLAMAPELLEELHDIAGTFGHAFEWDRLERVAILLKKAKGEL